MWLYPNSCRNKHYPGGEFISSGMKYSLPGDFVLEYIVSGEESILKQILRGENLYRNRVSGGRVLGGDSVTGHRRYESKKFCNVRLQHSGAKLQYSFNSNAQKYKSTCTMCSLQRPPIEPHFLKIHRSTELLMRGRSNKCVLLCLMLEVATRKETFHISFNGSDFLIDCAGRNN